MTRILTYPAVLFAALLVWAATVLAGILLNPLAWILAVIVFAIVRCSH